MEEHSKVTRVCIIDKDKKVYDNHKIKSLHLDWQDGGQTLKVFVDWTHLRDKR